jgi:hypothetical protein
LVQQQQLSPGNALPLLLAAHEAQLGALEDAVQEYTVKHVTGAFGTVCWCTVHQAGCLAVVASGPVTAVMHVHDNEPACASNPDQLGCLQLFECYLLDVDLLVADITRASSSPLTIEAVAVAAPVLGGKLAWGRHEGRKAAGSTGVQEPKMEGVP